jgi:hypothetical protein
VEFDELHDWRVRARRVFFLFFAPASRRFLTASSVTAR